MMARVLVVEDEDTLRNSVVRGLAKLPGIEALGAGSVADAVAILDRAPPDVVISDLDLPDRPGVELIGELGRRGIRCPVTFVSAYTRAFAAQIPRHAGVRVLEKPVPLDRLRDIVLADLDRRATAPPPAPFSVADYVQLSALGGHSVRITATRGGGVPVGEVVMFNGVLWSARDERGSGAEAFQRLAFAPRLAVECRSLSGDPGPRRIEAGWEGLLLDAARHLDEAAHANGRSVDDELAMALCDEEPEPEPDPFELARDRGLDALLARDYAAAFDALSEADRIRPGDPLVTANLARLRALGVGGKGEDT